MNSPIIVPTPTSMSFSGKWIEFDGFENFPEHFSKDFEIPRGSWSIQKLKKEGCGVQVAGKTVEIWGDERVCYATLIQLVKQHKGFIPEIKVEESFDFEIRGFHLDIARGGVPKVETFKKIIRWLFLLKYNFFAIYFEDLYPWKSFDDIGLSRGRLGKEEYAEIEDYARLYGLHLVPSLELLGHMENILSLPSYAKYREIWWSSRDGCLDVSNTEAKSFALRLLEDVLETSKSVYVHVGGDETWSLGRGRSLDKNSRFTGPELYLDHYKSIISLVKKYRKIPIVWGDMLSGSYLTEEEKRAWSCVTKSDIWEQVLIANWDYSSNPQEYFENLIETVGHKSAQIASPGLSNWRSFYPDYETALTNLNNFLLAAKKKRLKGFLVTAWGDDGEECLFSFLEPLILAAIEIAEGIGKWEEGWQALTGEDQSVIQLRKALGSNSLPQTLRDIIYLNQRVFKHFEIKNAKDALERITKMSEGLNLPVDLRFVVDMVRTALSIVQNKASVSDYFYLAKSYSALWLNERKPQGLQVVLTKLWGSAAVLDTLREFL